MAMRELPFTVNVSQEQEKIEIEKMRDALLGALTAYTQAIPQLATTGGDPSEVVRKIADVIKARQKGQALEDAIEETFAPEQQVPPAGVPSVEQPSPVPPGSPVGGSPEGAPMPPEGMPMPGGAPQAPPSIQSLLSGLSGGGTPTASVRTVTRR
jgi:hypothetical protein